MYNSSKKYKLIKFTVLNIRWPIRDYINHQYTPQNIRKIIVCSGTSYYIQYTLSNTLLSDTKSKIQKHKIPKFQNTFTGINSEVRPS